MRKSSFITYIVMTAIAVMTFSCSLHEEYPSQSGSINLEFKCSDLLTRADGDPETAIESIDYFIYTSQDGSAVYHNRITTTSTTAIVDGVEELEQDGKTCYVYAVANLPSDVTISGTETIAALQAISVTTDFTKTQTSFVMDSEEAVTATVGSSATVNLHRLAAKLTMTVNIPVSVESGSITYEPDYGNLRIYYVNAVKKGTFNGSYMTYGNASSEDANKANYFPYPYDWTVSVTGEDGQPHVGTTETPFYTYPQSWEQEEVHEPYFKVVLPWAASGSASNSKPYYYKVVIPNSFDGKIDRNTFYKFVLDIGVLGSEVDDGSVEVTGDYYVVEWSKAFTVGGDDGDDALTKGKYLSVAQNDFSIYADPGITIPVISSHNLRISSVTCTYTDYSSDNPTPKTLTSGFTVTPNDRSSVTLTHELVSDITSESLDCSIYEFIITIANEGGCNPVTVKVTQYPSLYITSEESNKYVFINNNSNHASSGWTNNSYKLIYDDGGVGAHTTLTQTFEFARKDGNSYSGGGVNVTLNNVEDNNGLFGYRGKKFGTANNRPGIMTITAPEGENITGLTITYYSVLGYTFNSQDVTYNPPVSGSSKTNWSGSTHVLTVTMPYSSSDSNSNILTAIRVSYTGYETTEPDKLGALRYYNYSVSGNNNFHIYTVNVSNLSGNTSGWYIADPRKSELETIDRLKGGGSQPLTGYQASDPSASNAIAPQFKIASSAGASLYSNQDYSRMTYEQARNRCASYQEDGYPAGRWRIPTDAEIRFVISLSDKGKIPSLFYGTYWAASGAKLDNKGEETVTNNGASVRCVYDSWYWGDEPMSQYMTTWSGFQTD